MPPVSAPRRQWEPPARSAVQERFYRELMVLDRLPSAPEIAQRMLVAINRDDSSVDHVATLIERDPALTARLLRLANSAFFASRARVGSIPQAVVVLGFPRVRDLALGLSVWSSFDGKDPAGRRYRKKLWMHSAMVAAAAQMLSQRTRGDGGLAFAAGLLHDVGKLVLGLRLGGSYWSLLDEAAERGDGAAALESEAFGCHHATIGGWLLQLWGLPAEIVEAVALHHDPLRAEFGMDASSAVGVANRLIDATDPESGAVRQDILSEVGEFLPGLFDPETWRDVYGSIAREQQSVANLFAA